MGGRRVCRAGRKVWPATGENPPLLAGRVLVRYPDSPPLERFRRGLEIAQQHNDTCEIAFCQRLVGHWLSHTDFNHAEGLPLLESSLQGFQALDNKFCAAQVLDDLGWSHRLMMKQDRQAVLVKQSLDLRREIGDKIGMANSLRNMGGSVGGFFEPTGQAFNYWKEAKAICYEMNERLGIACNASLKAEDVLLKHASYRPPALVD